MAIRLEIPLRLPSANQYIEACRKNRYVAAKMKSDTEKGIIQYLGDLPHFERPVKIHFTWVEKNGRRDLDGCAFGKKFVLDAMVKAHVLTDDSRKYVCGFTDDFAYGNAYKVVLEIEELNDVEINKR